MSFLNLPVWGIALGWLGLAGGLFLLQRLRVRHRRVEVPTTMFWRQVVEESRARVLTERFRHPWTYLLLLAIATLLWFAVSGLQRDADAKRTYLLVLDGSVGMSQEGRFEHAVERLLEDVDGLPAAQREVWWSAGEQSLLLAKGEHGHLLEARLQGVAPHQAAASVESWILRQAQAPVSEEVGVRLYGDAVVREEALGFLPAGMDVRRATELAPALPGNRGFLQGGLEDAASGYGDRVDLYLEICGTEIAPTVSVAGEALDLQGISTATTHGTAWRFTDVPARGQILTFQLASGDAYPADDAMTLALPQRRPLRVLLSPALRPWFGPVLAADHGLVAATEEADLVIRSADEELAPDLPALVVGPLSLDRHAFHVTDQNGVDADRLLQEVHVGLGLHQIDALGLAQELQQPISLGVSLGDGRSVQLWERLLEPTSGFLNSQSFPLFVGSALRWLGGSRDFANFAHSGQPIASSVGTWDSPAATQAVTAGGPLQVAEAGLYRSTDGRSLAVSALDLSASLGAARAQDVEAAEEVGTAGIPMWSWLVLLALLLLAFEWSAFQSGRIA
ncbi:MAG: hypothetical protein ACPG31_11360 [Planctomycetota bacterium]